MNFISTDRKHVAEDRLIRLLNESKFLQTFVQSAIFFMINQSVSQSSTMRVRIWCEICNWNPVFWCYYSDPNKIREKDSLQENRASPMKKGNGKSCQKCEKINLCNNNRLYSYTPYVFTLVPLKNVTLRSWNCSSINLLEKINTWNWSRTYMPSLYKKD